MLEIRPVCENCNKRLEASSLEARICSFECTFCAYCVEQVLHNVCPKCGGGFEKRPVRPKEKLLKFPAITGEVFKPVDPIKFEELLSKNRKTPPHER